MNRAFVPSIILVACIAWPAAQGPQPSGPPRTVYERYTQPIQIFSSGLGTFSRPISSTNRDAQAFFNQGFQMMYAFAKAEAVRSFEKPGSGILTARSATGVKGGPGAHI